MPDEEFRPGTHDPVEWKRQNPGWVSFPATFVPHPRPIPKWKIINGQRWPLDKRGRPWPRTRYGRPTCPFDELPPGMPTPGTQHELMRKLENPTLFWKGESMPTMAEVLAIGERSRAERAAAAQPPPIVPVRAYDGDGLGPARDYLAAMAGVNDSVRQATEDAAYWSVAPSERLAMPAAVLDRNGAAALAAARKIGSQPSGAPKPLASPGSKARAVPHPSEVVLSDADPDPVLEGRQYAAAPLALAVVPALRFGAPYVARGLGALLGTGAGVVLSEIAKPSGEETPRSETAAEANEEEATQPPISQQKQDGHISGTPQSRNRSRNGASTSISDGTRQEADRLVQEAWAKGKSPPEQPNVRDYDFNRPIGTGSDGRPKTKMRVHQDRNGRIHGHLVGM